MIYCITGNKDKFSEVKAIVHHVEQRDIDLPEIQELDAREVVKAKLQEALKVVQGDIVVEDTSLYLHCLKGLPGPFIKLFLKTIGNEGLVELAVKYGDARATARTVVGYVTSAGEIHFFEGALEGTIVAPRGENDFGWGPIFQPEGYSKTFGEMSREEKNAVSMRGSALRKLKEYLNAKKSDILTE
ncbi:non-canonical purine NTP pyrophosphatase [Candidatus Uhrbacteria bacterium]|nr:non-canonical purine NTP pyrophosphatase [Candidatus Uhrbacteria bacterium]